LPSNIRLGWNLLAVETALAYSKRKPPGSNPIKTCCNKITHSFCKLDRLLKGYIFSIAIKWPSLRKDLINVVCNVFIGMTPAMPASIRQRYKRLAVSKLIGYHRHSINYDSKKFYGLSLRFFVMKRFTASLPKVNERDEKKF
jgi:hypothetical protein